MKVFLSYAVGPVDTTIHPNYGSDDDPPDGLLSVWIPGLAMFKFTRTYRHQGER
jgi:hypothetical protein